MIYFNVDQKLVVVVPHDIVQAGGSTIIQYCMDYASQVHEEETLIQDWVRINDDYWNAYSIVWIEGWPNPHYYWSDDADQFLPWENGEVPPQLPQAPAIDEAPVFSFQTPATGQASLTISADSINQWLVGGGASTVTVSAEDYLSSFIERAKMAAPKKQPKKKAQPKFESLQEEVDFYKKECKELEKLVDVTTQSLEKVKQDYGVVSMRVREKDTEITMLKANTVDSEKLKTRIKLLSKQLGVPLAQTKNVNQIMDDFLAQMWCRIKHEPDLGPDELAS